ncbi:Mediator of RNA polymerase II transcription subunit 13 [Nakaseomyces bracarensis]|uniref:Mediator of RNA polymerase II transcription subunit 13 n=1 Tax=Nakaseomyces bracarensis TaxID=273131 RepID=A0ABR4P006_9SACH
MLESSGLVSNFYRLENIEKINYAQYLPKKQDDQWGIQMELQMRKRDRTILVSLLSRELWCFSINDAPLPSPNDIDPELNAVPDKTGDFNADYSKPNLPPHYALFLKSLKRMIYLNLVVASKNTLLQFGNSCIHTGRNNQPSNLLQIEPHLFSNSELAISICLKDIGLQPLNVNGIDQRFLETHALYMAPSGVRVYLAENKLDSNENPNEPFHKYFVPAPENGDALLKTLHASHGIDLRSSSIRWVNIIPNLTHLNGRTPNISQYMEPPREPRTIIWPVSLIFAQPAADIKDNLTTMISEKGLETFEDTLSIIDNFVQLKQSSSYRTPGSSGGLTGTNIGSNLLSSEGGYTDQFQNYNAKSVAPGPQGMSNPKVSPNEAMTPSYPGIDKMMEQKNFTPEFSTSPSTSGANGNELFNDRKVTTHELLPSPTKMDIDQGFPREAANIPNSTTDNEIKSEKENGTSNSPTNADLFGEDDDDENDDADLFGDSNNSTGDSNPNNSKGEITEDIFASSDEENISSQPEDNRLYFDQIKNEQADHASIASNRSALKRTYLDIRIEETPLSSPLYTDPGAPLPVETPRDRRKSVFAPLNFNPIIENDVDNKYKNGGKYSFSPLQKEEALNFDVSRTELSSSEGDDSESSDDDLEDLATKNDNTGYYRSADTNYGPYSNLQDTVPTGLIRQDLIGGGLNAGIDLSKDTQNSIWKIPQTDMSQTESPLKVIDNPIQSDETNMITRSDKVDQQNFKDSPIKMNNEPPYDATKSENKYEYMNNFPSSFPFLLRHMPLSLIPDTFIYMNPTITITEKKGEILDLLAEQIVFDYSILSDLGIPDIIYSGVRSCNPGIILNTMSGLFSDFSKLNGDQIISKIYHMDTPFVAVRKQHEQIKIRSDAQQFTKYLNLKPLRGIKNFKFLLLTDSFREDCIQFISSLSQTYINHEFGFCEHLQLTNEDTKGLIYLTDFEENKLLLLAAQIVSYFSTNRSSGKEVAFMLLLPIQQKSLAEIVEKTVQFQIIQNEVKAKIPNMELYLKIIPMDFIKNPLTSVDDYTNLCISIYNILPSKVLKFTNIRKQIPEKLTFKTSQPASVFNYDAYIHLAYSRSVDKQWMFAALSDSTGKENMMKTWYLGSSKGKFDEACNQIWEMALTLAGKNYGKICLILTRLNGILPDDELMNWRRLSGRNIHLAVVCVDDNTKISFFDQNEDYPNYKKLLNGHEPETLDPTRIDDYEVRDLQQNVYGVVFENPFPLVNSLHRCAIKSGALIRFNNSTPSEPLSLEKFEVNLLNCPHSDSFKLLETILEEFRNLAALNVWYGVTNGENGHIPWHVLAVKKMMKTLVHTRVKVNK